MVQLGFTTSSKKFSSSSLQLALCTLNGAGGPGLVVVATVPAANGFGSLCAGNYCCRHAAGRLALPTNTSAKNPTYKHNHHTREHPTGTTTRRAEAELPWLEKFLAQNTCSVPIGTTQATGNRQACLRL